MEASAIRRHRITRPRGGVASPRVLRVASDELLVALLRDGNAAAFEAVYERHHRGLLSFARHMLGSREEAEDAIQRTFLSAHAELVRTDKPIQLKPWLYSIARNRCISILRVRRDEASADELDIATEGLSDQVQRRADLQELLVDLRRLPDAQREALVLAEIGALAHDDIARVIDVPTQKVRALVFQARESLVASRAAREVSCPEIREQVANARGAALRRDPLQRHLRDCAGCRHFAGEVKRQRAAMAVLVPVIPSLAFKQGAMPASVAAQAGSAAGGLSAGALAPSALKGLAVKALVAAAAVGVGAGGAAEIGHQLHHRSAAPSNPGTSAPGPSSTTAPALRPQVKPPGTAVSRARARSGAGGRAADSRPASRHGRDATRVPPFAPLGGRKGAGPPALAPSNPGNGHRAAGSAARGGSGTRGSSAMSPGHTNPRPATHITPRAHPTPAGPPYHPAPARDKRAATAPPVLPAQSMASVPESTER